MFGLSYWPLGCFDIWVGGPSTIGVELSITFCTWIGPGEGCLMGDVADSSLTLLPFSSWTIVGRDQFHLCLIALVL